MDTLHKNGGVLSIHTAQSDLKAWHDRLLLLLLRWLSKDQCFRLLDAARPRKRSGRQRRADRFDALRRRQAPR